MGIIRKAIGVSSLGVVNPRSKKERALALKRKELNEEARHNRAEEKLVTQQLGPAETPEDRITRLAALRDDGVLTEREFEVKRLDVLRDAGILSRKEHKAKIRELDIQS